MFIDKSNCVTIVLRNIEKRVKQVFSNEANLPPSGQPVAAKSLDWAARQAAAARRKTSTASAVEGKAVGRWTSNVH